MLYLKETDYNKKPFVSDDKSSKPEDSNWNESKSTEVCDKHYHGGYSEKTCSNEEW